VVQLKLDIPVGCSPA